MKPYLSLSLDLDNKWSYMKTHGDAGWETWPSYLDELAEIVLERLRHHGLQITFFVVGQDAALPENAAALRALRADGHEIANHSFRHEPWLDRYGEAEVVDEITRAEEAIQAATGMRPRGFRGPGFAVSEQLLEVLLQRGYTYDASTFPTFLGPLARAYYFLGTRGLSKEEKEERRTLFGSWRNGLRPIDPYLWESDRGSLVELPVTTFPLFRTPIHLSYLLYLSRFSRLAARAYLASALTACRIAGTAPSFLLHPLDFLGRDRVDGLEFFPGMELDTSVKLRFFDEVIGSMKKRFELVNMEEHARRAADAGVSRRAAVGSAALP